MTVCASMSGWSLDDFNDLIKAWIVGRVPPDTEILDVGAGAGKYGRMLRKTHPNIDALDVCARNVLIYDLFQVYRNVYIADVREFDVSRYGFVIFGDVLEHLPVADAQRVVAACPKCLIQVPFLYEQGPLDGNDAEVHIQDDLTPEVMLARYPGLKELAKTGKLERGCGVYVKEPK